MTKPFLLVAGAVALLGAGAAATAQATLGGPPPSESPQSTIEVPTALEDWCTFMDAAFGPGAPAPDVAAAVDASLTAGAATPEVAYAAHLGGVPAELAAPVATLRAAVELLVAGDPVVDPGAVRDAARSVDAFDQSACGG